MFAIVPNDGAVFPKTLYKDGQTFAIAPSSTVQAALLSRDHSKLLAGPVPLRADAAGADWSVSELVIEFTADDLAGITESMFVTLEVQVESGGQKMTWFDEGEVRIGHIL